MAEERRCGFCRGRGYHVCDCWPGDCICGFGDETCDECEGTGFLVGNDYYPDDPDECSSPGPGTDAAEGGTP